MNRLEVSFNLYYLCIQTAYPELVEGPTELIEILRLAPQPNLQLRATSFSFKTPIEAFRNIELQNVLDRFKETKIPVSQEIVLGNEDRITLDVNISSIQGLPEGEGKTMILFHDVTRLKKLEKMRADFVANVTHEIKTPLTAILGFIETLQEGAIEERETARKFLKTIYRHAARLNRLVEDLLTISDRGLHVDFGSHVVTVNNEKVELSPTEFKLLKFLSQRPGRVYTRDQLLDHVWGDDAFVEPRTVDVHIKRLRSQIEKDLSKTQYILTIRGVGYKFADIGVTS